MTSTAVRTEPIAACPAGETFPDRDALVRTNLALVHHLVREVLARVPGHVHRDELISAGMFALTRAPRPTTRASGSASPATPGSGSAAR